MAKQPKKPVKKVAAKKAAKLEEIKAKKVGKNLIVVLPDGDKLVKPYEEKLAKSVSTKVALFNKTNNPTRKADIVSLMKTEGQKQEETEETTKKGLKKSIKKIEKEAPEKAEPETGEVILKKVREAHAAGTVTDEDIKSLKDLIAKHEEKKAEQPQQERGRESGGRERYR